MTEHRSTAEPPAGWPANEPPERRGNWERFEASDREAGFDISKDFRRFNQRDDIFNRAWWDEEVRSDDVVAFYQFHQKPLARRGDGFRQWDFALLNAAWSVARTYAVRGSARGAREGFTDPFETFIPQAPVTAEPMSIEENSARIKHVAKFLGADLVGITEYDERWVYTKSVNVSTEEREEKPNDIPEGLTSVIVLGHEMDHELVKSYPSALAASATGREYSREAAIVSSLASFIHGLGYKAVGSSNDTGLTIPYAIKAGMGEYGRNQLVITEEFGPRVRFSKVFTDLPLLHDKPKRFGVHEFCSICNMCADACPPKALPKGPPQEGGPNRSSIQGIKKWTSNAEKCFGYWTKLRADCAICMRVCSYNKDFSGWRARVFRRLMGTSLRRLMLKLDDRFDFGKRRAPNAWWQLGSGG